MLSYETMETFEPTEFNTLVYGEGKVGKTTLIKTLPASAQEKILYIGVDPGQIALRGTKISRVTVPNNQWTTDLFRQLYDDIAAHATNWEWLAIDGVDDIADVVVAERLEKRKDGRLAWDEANKFMDAWIKSVRDIQNIKKLFITHVTQTQIGSEVKYTPEVPGKFMKQRLNEYFDLIMAMRMVPEDKTGTNIRVLQCNRDMSAEWECGDRTGVLETFETPDLTQILTKIEGKIPSLKISSVTRLSFAAKLKTDKEFLSKVKNYCIENKKKAIQDLTESEMAGLLNS
jgi:hypothetical protein